ncbi:MAG TPA: hypothetical protein VL966_11540 [Alphaproteobacteria bacterium]|jgi:hypothetical protein|nr:hypothetical protein [Alphaproteobacteria bacterium]
MSIVGTLSAPRQDGVALGPSLTRLALGLIVETADGKSASAAPASPAAPAPAIPLETGVDFTTLFAVRYAAALRAVERRREPKDQRPRKEGSSW